MARKPKIPEALPYDHEHEVAGKKFKMADALPLTWGDWVDLESVGLDPMRFEKPKVRLTLGEMMAVFGHLAKKANPDISTGDVRALKVSSPVIGHVIAQFGKALQEEAESPESPT